MRTLPFPLLTLLSLLPIGVGVLLAISRDLRRARAVAIATAGLLLLLAAAAAAAHRLLPGPDLLVDPLLFAPDGERALFGIDRLSAPLLPFVAAVTLALFCGMPRLGATPQLFAGLLVCEGCALGELVVLHLLHLAALIPATLLPGLILAGRGAEPDRFQVASALRRQILLCAGPLVAAVALLAWQGALLGRGTALYLPSLVLAQGGGVELLAAALVGLAVLGRVGVAPLHTGLLISIERGSLGPAVLTAVNGSGLYLLARVLLRCFSASAAPVLDVLMLAGAATAGLAALAALAQRDLLRLFGFVTLSQTGMLLCGLCSRDAAGVAGALVQWIALGIGLTGLSLCIAAVEARAGTTELPRLGGIARHAPGLAAATLLFAAAVLGFPGSLGFIAEDMLAHGLLETSPWAAGLLVLTTALCGVALVAAYARAFLGPPSPSLPAMDLLPRERVTAAALLFTLLCCGLHPAPVVSTLEASLASLASPAQGVHIK